MGKRCQIKHRGPTNCPACDLDTIEALRAELELVRAELVRARERARRFYRADGTFENLASEDEAIQRRIQAAAENAKMRERLHHPCDGCPGCSSNDCPDALDVAQIDLAQLRGEHEKLRARVGWLDLLDTEEGRRTYADEALRVALEDARAENAALSERVEVLERVREAAIVADDFVWGGSGGLYLDPKTTVPWVGQFHKVRDELREALAAAKPAAQESKEGANG